MVPWWNEECRDAIGERNRAFRKVRGLLTQDNVIDYQRKRAIVPGINKSSKRNAWRPFCVSIGGESELRDVWAMIKTEWEKEFS